MNWIYVSCDGDAIGSKIGRLSLQDDVEGIQRLGQAIEAGNNLWKQWALSFGGQLVESGGDEIRIRIPAERLKELPPIRKQYETAVGATCSVGVGMRLSEADKALMAAKLLGKDQIVLYEPSVEKVLADSRQPSEAEKINDAYLNKAQRVGVESPVGPEEPVGEQDPQLQQQQQQPEPLHDPEVLHDDFAQLAQQHEAEDQGQQQQQQQQVQGLQGKQDLKQQVVKVLKVFQSKAQELEQLQQQDPELYRSMVGMVQGMVAMAHELFGSGQEQPQEQRPGLEKAEVPAPPSPAPALHGTVEGFMAGLQALPKAGASRGKFVTQHLNHAPFLSALKAHPQGAKVHQTMTAFVNSPQNAGFRPGAAVAVAKSEKVEVSPEDSWDLEDRLRKDLMPGGRGDDEPDSEFDPEQLKAGAETEMKEHGLDAARALEVAKDHLSEDPSYYSVEKAGMEAGKTGKHLVKLPVGSQIDPGSGGHDKGGRIKVLDQESGKTKWRSVRSGMIQAPDGTPQSSRRGSE